MTTLSSGSNHLRSRQGEKWADLNEMVTGHLSAWNSKQPVLNGWKWWFPEITISHIKIYRDSVHHRIDSQPLKNAWPSGSRCFFSTIKHTAWLGNSCRLGTLQDLLVWMPKNLRKPSVTGFFGRVGKKHDWANDLRLNKHTNKKRPFQTSFFFLNQKNTTLGGDFFCGMVKAGLGAWFFVHFFLVHGWVDLPRRYRWYRVCSHVVVTTTVKRLRWQSGGYNDYSLLFIWLFILHGLYVHFPIHFCQAFYVFFSLKIQQFGSKPGCVTDLKSVVTSFLSISICPLM